MINVDDIKKAEVYEHLRADLKTLVSRLPEVEGLFDAQNFTGEIMTLVGRFQEELEELIQLIV